MAVLTLTKVTLIYYFKGVCQRKQLLTSILRNIYSWGHEVAKLRRNSLQLTIIYLKIWKLEQCLEKNLVCFCL